jgi:ketosteroid isomerase-like protein
MALTIEELAGEYHQAWTDKDPDVIAALHTEDSVFDIHGLTEAAVGRPSIRDLIATLLTATPTLHFEPKRIYMGADHIVFEYDMSGSIDGSDYVCDGVDVIAVSDGLVARKDTYLDIPALVRQVGDLPELTAAV